MTMSRVSPERQTIDTSAGSKSTTGRPGDASAAFDEDTYRRLSEVKGRLDPDDLFSSSHPVRGARVSG